MRAITWFQWVIQSEAADSSELCIFLSTVNC